MQKLQLLFTHIHMALQLDREDILRQQHLSGNDDPNRVSQEREIFHDTHMSENLEFFHADET